SFRWRITGVIPVAKAAVTREGEENRPAALCGSGAPRSVKCPRPQQMTLSPCFAPTDVLQYNWSDQLETGMTLDRRQWLWHVGGGLGGIALAQMLGGEGLLASAPPRRDPLNGGLHHKAKAKRVVQLFMSGAASQCDTFDYKPMLIKKDGQKFDPGGKVELFQSVPGKVMQSPWKWRQHGKCGKWVSDLLPHLAGCVDDMAFIHSMVSKSNVHGPATFMQATGFVLPGFPSMGSWISYGLGSLSR